MKTVAGLGEVREWKEHCRLRGQYVMRFRGRRRESVCSRDGKTATYEKPNDNMR